MSKQALKLQIILIALLALLPFHSADAKQSSQEIASESCPQAIDLIHGHSVPGSINDFVYTDETGQEVPSTLERRDMRPCPPQPKCGDFIVQENLHEQCDGVRTLGNICNQNCTFDWIVINNSPDFQTYLDAHPDIETVFMSPYNVLRVISFRNIALSDNETVEAYVETYLNEIKSLVGTENIVPDVFIKTATEPEPADVVEPVDQYSWSMCQVGAPPVWYQTLGNPAVTIAMIDTGINTTHQDLAGGFGILGGHTTCSANNCTESSDFQSYSSHGNRTFSGIVQSAWNGIGIAGLAPYVSVYVANVSCLYCNPLADYNVPDRANKTRFSYILDALARATNLSPEGPNIRAKIVYAGFDLSELSNEQLSKLALNQFLNQSMLVIPAGNSNREINKVVPSQRVIVVGATDDNDLKTHMSNYGSWVTLTAPGISVPSINDPAYEEPNASYVTLDYPYTWPNSSCMMQPTPGAEFNGGTSVAAAHVAGGAALIASINPTFNALQIVGSLITGADRHPWTCGYLPGDFTAESYQMGSGRMNLYAASRIAQGQVPYRFQSDIYETDPPALKYPPPAPPYPTIIGTAPLFVTFRGQEAGLTCPRARPLLGPLPYIEYANYYWNFGDGDESFIPHETIHVYEDPGEYLATLTIKDNCDYEGKPFTIRVVVGECTQDSDCQSADSCLIGLCDSNLTCQYHPNPQCACNSVVDCEALCCGSAGEYCTPVACSDGACIC